MILRDDLIDASEAEALEFFEVGTLEELHGLLDCLMRSHVVYLWWKEHDGGYYIILEPYNPFLEPGWQG